jgi:MFS family permease
MKKLKRLGMDYWKYWIASAGSMAASNILQYILALYVMDITGSATIFASMLSIILFPRLLLTPLAGVISDRTNRMKAMSFILLGETAVLVISFLITSIVPIHVAGIFALVTVLEIGEVFILVIPIVQKLKPDKIFRTSTKLIAVEIALIGAFAYMGVAHILPVYVTVIVITLLDCMTIAEAIPMQMAGSILLQTGIDEKYLGRVSSVIGMVTSISIAAGELLFGVLDDQINVPFTILVGAMGVAIGAMIYSFGSSKSKMNEPVH